MIAKHWRKMLSIARCMMIKNLVKTPYGLDQERNLLKKYLLTAKKHRDIDLLEIYERICAKQ